ncbi:hypothetical protein LCGC14_1056350 [marine sediment metagenome]|uniref:Uncharacterized protein n=1 Tax=marine sediment metagenome TaxID=412755 RepID=A0A0F9N982_9ZZZZ
MIYDINYFYRRYHQIESDFLEIMDFIHISDQFGDPCYKIGSSKLMDFCLKVGSEIETLFREILNDKKFDSEPDIATKRENQNIKVYRDVIEAKYNLRDYSLYVKSIKTEIFPFINFDSTTPEWFKIYSKDKHNKLNLIQNWNMRHSLFSLGALLLLVINHPSVEDKVFNRGEFSNLIEIFNLLGSAPRFCQSVI